MIPFLYGDVSLARSGGRLILKDLLQIVSVEMLLHKNQFRGCGGGGKLHLKNPEMNNERGTFGYIPAGLVHRLTSVNEADDGLFL